MEELRFTVGVYLFQHHDDICVLLVVQSQDLDCWWERQRGYCATEQAQRGEESWHAEGRGL